MVGGGRACWRGFGGAAGLGLVVQGGAGRRGGLCVGGQGRAGGGLDGAAGQGLLFVVIRLPCCSRIGCCRLGILSKAASSHPQV